MVLIQACIGLACMGKLYCSVLGCPVLGCTGLHWTVLDCTGCSIMYWAALHGSLVLLDHSKFQRLMFLYMLGTGSYESIKDKQLYIPGLTWKYFPQFPLYLNWVLVSGKPQNRVR